MNSINSINSIRFPDDRYAKESMNSMNSMNSIQEPKESLNEGAFRVANELLNDIALPLMRAEEETKPSTKQWEPQKLNGRHREIMRQILEGATYVEIAESLGLSPQSIMLVANSAIFKEELAKLEAASDYHVMRRAEELSNEALSKLRNHMRSAHSQVLQASCAEKILGIAGYSRIEKKAIAVVSGEDVIRALNRQRRSASSSTGAPQSAGAFHVAKESFTE